MSVEEVFLSAIERPQGAERDQFLLEAFARQPEIRMEVLELLKCHETAGEFLARPLVNPVKKVVAETRKLKSGEKIGPYRIVSFIGQGGMGVVYRAIDLRLDRIVALKIMAADRSRDEQWIRRFHREARSAGSLNHPNIITIHEVGEFDGQHFIATEFVEGVTLRKYAGKSPIQMEQALEITLQIAAAMDSAHKNGVIHRDLKPDNVMVRPDGLVKVLDFGLAKPAEASVGAESDPEHTSSASFRSEAGIVVGTTSYMSPEQLRGQELDGRSDVFSLGIIFFQLLTGRHPFRGGTSNDVMAAILEKAPLSFTECNASLPGPVVQWVHRCLVKDRDHRATSRQLVEGLRQIKESEAAESRLSRASAIAPLTTGESSDPLTRAITGSSTSGSVTSIGPEIPQVHYARSGEVNIAWQQVGKGPIDLIFVMGWVSHLEWFWREPSFAGFLRGLAGFCRVILFDKRGTGLSDRVPLDELPTLEQRMDDVRAVMEAAGSRRAVLCGVSEGGPMTALFAATYPQRTLALIMIGCYARRLWAPDYPWGPTEEQRKQFLDDILRSWGGPVGIEDRAPSRANDPEFRKWWGEYLRMGASPGAAVALTNMNAQIDVRSVLPAVQVPALVIHRTGDRCLKVEEGRFLAAQIPAARMVELEGSDHLPFVGDSEAVITEIRQFVTGVRGPVEADSVLATAVHAKIIDVMPLADEIPAIEAQITRFRALADREFDLFRGGSRSSSDEGVTALFDGPARALRAGLALRDTARRLGVRVQIAVHTGECEVAEGIPDGPAVRAAVATSARAGVYQVLLTQSVYSLVAGSALEIVEVSSIGDKTEPKGMRLYEVVR
jgi:serine/threonine protein kinase/alpha-beta hydrolase superfamily lysophospholipase